MQKTIRVGGIAWAENHIYWYSVYEENGYQSTMATSDVDKCES